MKSQKLISRFNMTSSLIVDNFLTLLFLRLDDWATIYNDAGDDVITRSREIMFEMLHHRLLTIHMPLLQPHILSVSRSFSRLFASYDDRT